MRKPVIIVLAVLAVAGLSALGFWGLGLLGSDARVMREEAGTRAVRQHEAESLARHARDFRMMAQHYQANGEKKKAQRAIGAAQELDKKIAKLLEEEK